jgi:hypothetical protein
MTSRIMTDKAFQSLFVKMSNTSSSQDDRFDLSQLVCYLRSKPDGDLAMFYELAEGQKRSSRGIVEVCSKTGRINR